MFSLARLTVRARPVQRALVWHQTPLTQTAAFHATTINPVFIQTDETPNPESLKFVPTGVTILDAETGFYITKNDSAHDILRSPLAKRLFDIEGVKAVYLGNDFVTVTKYAEHKWKFLRPRLFNALMEWVDSDQPALMDQPEITDTTILEDDGEVVAMIKELIEARIRPAVQEDGGDIKYVSFDEETGMVTVQLAGSCVGCPSSSVTLKQGVENMLMHYIPEVTAVQALEEENADEVAGHSHEHASASPPVNEASTKQKSYEERLAAAGIPFSD
jgi:NFU1 iron-sulfur cluster scaffold homolog, mitochondrial